VNPSPIEITDDELEAALRDLGSHLDLGVAGTGSGRADLVTSILDRIAHAGNATGADAPPTVGSRARPGRTRARRVILAVAAAVLVLAGLLIVTPTREAIADWFGIGAVRITTSEAPLPTDDPSGDPPASVDLDVARRAMPFAIRLADPALAGPPMGVSVDPAVRAGLVEILYKDFTLVEVALAADRSSVLEKSVGPGTTITPVVVGARAGVWIAGEPHTLFFVRPDGATDEDRVRRAGNVLLWEDGGVTYRVEGADSLDKALAVATSLR